MKVTLGMGTNCVGMGMGQWQWGSGGMGTVSRGLAGWRCKLIRCQSLFFRNVSPWNRKILVYDHHTQLWRPTQWILRIYHAQSIHWATCQWKPLESSFQLFCHNTQNTSHMATNDREQILRSRLLKIINICFDWKPFIWLAISDQLWSKLYLALASFPMVPQTWKSSHRSLTLRGSTSTFVLKLTNQMFSEHR